MGKIFYLVDIRFKQKNLNLGEYFNSNDYEILTLTPYSTYLLDKINMTYIPFDNICSASKFHNNVINQYKDYTTIFNDFMEFSFLFRDFAFFITYTEYIYQIQNYLKVKKEEGFEIYYITDAEDIEENKRIDYLYNSYLFKLKDINIKIISKKNKLFYRKNSIMNSYYIIRYKNSILNKLVRRYITKSSLLKYDNRNFSDIYKYIKPKIVKNKIEKNLLDDFYSILHHKVKDSKNNFFYKQFLLILDSFKFKLLSHNIETIHIKPFSYLSGGESFLQSLLYKYNDIPKIFTQHGAYLYSHFFLKYNEIYPADINFVLNEYTKKEFMKQNSSNAQVIESLNFNYDIKDEKKEFDFLYITHCATYSHSAVYIDGKESYYSVDANNIYERHKQIIELFGTKFKDKNICIKIQPGIMLESMLYIPFLELSEKYKNITIEFSVPIQKLIPQSKYIISDYFSSEFINRELHYKRDIILFNAVPLPLPEDIVEDMKKIFILIETVNDLENTIKNIEDITQNRKRYDDIIEYYSSKKCDTKKVVTEILEREFNARN